MRLRLWAMALAGTALAVQQRPAGRGLNTYSMEKEAQLGAALAAEVRKNSKALDSAAARDYVDRLGQELHAQLPAGGFTCTFGLIAGHSDALEEPQALAGGYIFVPAALFLAAQERARDRLAISRTRGESDSLR